MNIRNFFVATTGNRVMIAAFIVLLIFSAFLGSIYLPFVVTSIWLIYKMLSIKFGHKSYMGFLSILLLSCLSYILVLQSTLVIGWVLSREFPLMVSVFIAFIAIVIGIPLSFKKPLSLFRRSNIAGFSLQSNRNDLLALFTSILALVMLVAFPFFAYQNSHPDLVLSFINNVDDSVHLSIINDQIQFDRGLTTGSELVEKLRATVMYPTGWHASIAILFKSIDPSVQPGIATLKFYIISKILLFSVLMFFLTKSTLTLCQVVIGGKQSNTYHVLICASVLCGVLSSIFIFDIFREGFYSFFPQLISLPVLLLIAFHIKKAGTRDEDYWYIAFSYAILLTLSLSWILVMPVVILAFVMYLYILNDKSTYRVLSQIILKHPFLICISTITTVAVVISMTGSSEAISADAAILNSGGIAVYSINFFFLSILAILYVLWQEKPTKGSYAFTIPAVMAAALFLFALSIYFYQLAAIGSPRYYYYKVLYLVAITMIPLLSVLGTKFIVSIRSRSSVVKYSVLLLISGVLTWQFLTPTTVSYLAGQRFLGEDMRTSIYKNIGEYRENSHTLYYIAGHPIVMDNATRLMHSNEVSTECRKKAWEAFASGAKFRSAVLHINRYCAEYHIKIVAASYSKRDIEKEFRINGKPSNMEVEYIYLTPPGS